MNRFNLPEDLPIENRVLDNLIESSQERLEGYNFDMRKNVVEYDDVMNKQRLAIYNERREILLSESVNLDDKLLTAFETVVSQLAHDYLNDYLGFVRGEISQAITTYSTEATDTINVYGVVRRLRGILPGIMALDRDELDGLSSDRLTTRLLPLAEANLDEGTNLYQLLQAMSEFIPIMPAVPNIGRNLVNRRERVPARESLRRDFVNRVEQLNNDFLADQLDSAEKTAIWHKALNAINDAFVRYRVDGVGRETLLAQQDRFKPRVETALRELLVDSLAQLDSEQLVAALNGYVRKQANNWRAQIGDEQYRKYQRLLMLSAIDNEWRDYLTAMDDLRREIGITTAAQRDPKVEYKRRSFEMFQDMRSNIDEDVAKRFFREISRHQATIKQQEAAAKMQTQLSRGGYAVVEKKQGRGSELRRDLPKVGRNDACPCGSGKKYKNCHLRQDQTAAGQAAGQATNGRQSKGSPSGQRSRSSAQAARAKSKSKKRRRR